MKRQMRNIATVVFIYLFAFSWGIFITPQAAAVRDEALTAAQRLHSYGLFRGVGTNADGTPDFDLGRTPTRSEAMTMLVRLFRDENMVLYGEFGEENCPFIDVAKWAQGYVAYAYETGLTSGRSETIFGGEDPVSATEYLTFILRAMGYKSGEDFQWDRAWELTDKLGITDGRYNENIYFTRGDVAIVSLNALMIDRPMLAYGDWVDEFESAPRSFLRPVGTDTTIDVIGAYDPNERGYGGYLFTPIIPLKDVCVVSLISPWQQGINGDHRLLAQRTLETVGDLYPGQGIIVADWMGELSPNWGVTFTDQNGKRRGVSIFEDGRGATSFPDIWVEEEILQAYNGYEVPQAVVTAKYEPEGEMPTEEVIFIPREPISDVYVVSLDWINIETNEIENQGNIYKKEHLPMIREPLLHIDELAPRQSMVVGLEPSHPLDIELPKWAIVYTDQDGEVHSFYYTYSGGNHSYAEILCSESITLVDREKNSLFYTLIPDFDQ